MKPVFRFISSYGFAVVLLLFLLVLTYLGTIEQVEHGLYATQEKYFNSLFLVHDFGPIPVPLPGAYLLLILFCVNLICGGIIRAPKGWSHMGILIAHLGIVLMLAGSFVTFKYSLNGHLSVYEGQSSNEFESYHEWEIVVTGTDSSGSIIEAAIPQRVFTKLKHGKQKTFQPASLPIDVTIGGYEPRAIPRSAAEGANPGAKIVDGFYIARIPKSPGDANNIPGAYVTLTDKGSAEGQEGILWGASQHPFTVTLAGKKWTADLRRRRWTLPFTVTLDKFTHGLHPRTQMPKVFQSDITWIDRGDVQKARITMNEPFRHLGYTFYQSSWGKSKMPGGPKSSTLAVVVNPTANVPLYSTIIVTIGLLIHFARKLFKYLKTESAKWK
ncbi:cytochrome c biogenesis protein ResB [Candidatus Hydrogenedentota bacterium]